MSKPNDELLMALMSRLTCDQVWAIHEPYRQERISRLLAAGSVAAIVAQSEQTFERRGSLAVFRVHGVMVPQREWFDEVSTVDLATNLQNAARDEAVTAGVMLISSPGGMTLGQLEVEQAAAAFAREKPLIAQVEGGAYSAAYWLASQATEIYSGPRDDLGSIGVRSLVYDWSKFFEQAGVEAVDSNTGPLKSLGVVGSPITQIQRDFLQQRVDFVMGDFERAVRRGRNLNAAQFALVSTGGWWFGEQAVELGLSDGIRSATETFAALEAAQQTEGKTMTATKTTDAPPQKSFGEQAAEHRAAIVSACPGAPDEFVDAQVARGVSVADAGKAWMVKLQEEKEAADQRASEAEAAAQKLKDAGGQSGIGGDGKRRGAKAIGDGTETESSQDLDFRQMAKDYQKEHKCSWSQACYAIKKQYPEAREAFKIGPLSKFEATH